MEILKKHSDYYDHLGYQFGIDKKIIYDRRDSIELENFAYNTYAHYANRSYDFVIFEIGLKLFLFKVKVNSTERFHTSRSCYFEEANLIAEKVLDKKLENDYPINVYVASLKNNLRYWHRGPSVEIDGEEYLIEFCLGSNVILKDTFFTKFVDGTEVWKLLSTFISSLNNEKEIAEASNEIKIESHGFDKQSFRKSKG